jgi:DNA polymerase-3 subunit alpha
VRYKDLLAGVCSHRIEGLNEQSPPKIRLAGMIAQVQKVITKKGDPMARAVLEDLTGEIPLIVFPKAYQSGLDKQLKSSAIVSVAGRLSFQSGLKAEEGAPPRPELIVEEILPIDMALARFARSLTLHFSTVGLEDRLLEDLKRVLRRYPGRTPVFLSLETTTHGQALIETDEKVALQDRLFEQLGDLLGEKSWKIESAS